jgi:fumarylacetoacetate (FAA) hydrolase
LDRWEEVEAPLRALSARVEAGAEPLTPWRLSQLHAPLPRAFEWIDGSAYLNHVRLVRKARGAEMPPSFLVDPLVYQGGSSALSGPTDPIGRFDPAWGIDFESEVVAILGDVPQGCVGPAALERVRLLTFCNDVSLRGLIPNELAKGFGFFQSKPATAFAPVAFTPDEVGGAWRDGRLHLRLRTWVDDQLVGDVLTGPEMHFSFADLLAHLTLTRAYGAGTLLGSGTVSNEDRARGVSCFAESRMIETIERGGPETRFLQPGQRVRIALLDDQGQALAGTIEQVVEGR